MAESQKPTTWGWFTAFYVLNLIILSDLTSVQMTWHRLPKLNKGKKNTSRLTQSQKHRFGGFLKMGAPQHHGF